jgi:protein SCO1/2
MGIMKRFMPHIFAARPDPTCSHLNPQGGIQVFQPLGIDLSCPRARTRAERPARLLRRFTAIRVGAGFCRALAILAILLRPAYAAGGDGQLPVIGPAPPFSLTSQDGKPVSLADLRGKVVAVTFIYTECPDICPMLTQKMVQVQDELGADFGAKVAFVSISLDPEHDTPEVLKDYAQFWGAKPEGWSFLTGSPEAVRDVTRRYGVFFAKKEDGSVDHTQLTSLVDAEGRLRVQYLGARFDPEEFRRDLMSLADKE